MEGKETIKEGSRRKGRRQQSEVLYRVLYPNTHENGIKIKNKKRKNKRNGVQL